MAAKKPVKKAAAKTPAKKVSAPAKKATVRKSNVGPDTDIFSDEYMDNTRGPKPTRKDARYAKNFAKQINRSMGMTGGSAPAQRGGNLGSFLRGGGMRRGGR